MPKSPLEDNVAPTMLAPDVSDTEPPLTFYRISKFDVFESNCAMLDGVLALNVKFCPAVVPVFIATVRAFETLNNVVVALAVEEE